MSIPKPELSAHQLHCLRAWHKHFMDAPAAAREADCDLAFFNAEVAHALYCAFYFLEPRIATPGNTRTLSRINKWAMAGDMIIRLETSENTPKAPPTMSDPAF